MLFRLNKKLLLLFGKCMYFFGGVPNLYICFFILTLVFYIYPQIILMLLKNNILLRFSVFNRKGKPFHESIRNDTPEYFSHLPVRKYTAPADQWFGAPSCSPGFAWHQGRGSVCTYLGNYVECSWEQVETCPQCLAKSDDVLMWIEETEGALFWE